MEKRTFKRFIGLSLLVTSGLLFESTIDKDLIIYQEHLSRQKEINSYTIKESRNFLKDNFNYVDYLIIMAGIGLGSAYLAYGIKRD